MCTINNIENMLQDFTLQRRPYTTVADGLDCQYKNFLSNSGFTAEEAAPFDFTLLKTRPDGTVSFRWILGYDEEKFKHILNHKHIFQENAALVFSNCVKKTSLEKYYKEVLENPGDYDDIEFLTGVFHLTYKFVVPKAFNIGLIHNYHQEKQGHAYRAKICLTQQHDAAEIPFLQIEDSPPQPQVTEQFHKISYKPFEAFYQDWMYTIQGINFYQDRYKYPYLLYLPIYDGDCPPVRAVRGYLGVFFSDEEVRDQAHKYFDPPNNGLYKVINEAYLRGTRNSILDSYGENSDIQNPIEYWESEIRSLHHWRKSRLETRETLENSQVFWIEGDMCKISIARVLERKQIEKYVDQELKDVCKNKILSLEVPHEILAPEKLSLKIPYIHKRMKDAVLLLDELLKARMLLLNSSRLKNAHQKSKDAHRQSAIAKVMARNLSHNIGSHVLARMYSKRDFFGDEKTFRRTDQRIMALNSYVRTRMDFIAALSTSRPGVGASAHIYRDVMGYFKPRYQDQDDLQWQEILLDRISGIDDLKAKKIIISYLNNDRFIDLESPESDPRFACPNGILGMHALYIVLENIIRNSAKHAFDRSCHDRLEIVFETRDVLENDDLIEVCISDRLGNARSFAGSGAGMKLLDYINGRIGESILDENGALRGLAWGVLEMKICAAYLRNIPPEKLDGRHNPPLLEAVNIDSNLGYRFFLNRPKEVLIVDESKSFQQDDAFACKIRGNGIDIVGKEEFEEKLASNIEHKFLILDQPSIALLQDVKENLKALPMRILTSGKIDNAFPVINSEALKSLYKDSGDSAEGFCETVWQKWVQAKEPRVKLFIRPEDESTASHWNVDGLSEASITPDRILQLNPEKKYVIYDRHGLIDKDYSEFLEHQIACGQSLYYEPIQHKQPTHFLLSNVPETPCANQKIVNELIETGLVKITLFDERIQKAVEQLHGTNGFEEGMLERMNIFIPPKEKVDLDNPPYFEAAMERWVSEHLPNAAFFVLHLGILEKLFGDRYKGMSKWLERIEGDFPQLHIVLISGRGLPETIRKLQARFIQYSQVARYLLEERSKYHLCRALFAARRSAV